MSNTNDDARRPKRFRAPGFTQIPNEIFDEIMPVISHPQFKILCFVARRTFGFHRAADSLSLSDITTGTGVSASAVKESIAQLVEDGYIDKRTNQRVDGSFEPTTYCLSVEEEEGGVGRQKANPWPLKG